MINRITLKQRGKAAFLANYWPSVAAALVTFLVLSLAFKTGSDAAAPENRSALVNILVALVSSIGSLAALLLHILVLNVLDIGSADFFIRNTQGRAGLQDLLNPFRTSYGRNVLAMFLRSLFIALWSLLLVIPGIVKAYAYCMVPYILADDPNIGRMDALHLSESMMRGHKMEVFILDLSFIGWHILSTLTGGILGILYVYPYICATKAELYCALSSTKVEY